MSHVKQQRLKPLLDKVPPGFLVDTRYLMAQYINAKSIHNYVERGWLERVGRGVYRRPVPVNAETVVSWHYALLSLQHVMEYDVHLGGISALNLAGYSHYLHLGKLPHVHFYGKAPTWLKWLPCDAKIVLHNCTLFGDAQIGITDTDQTPHENGRMMEAWQWALKVSSPERAILEALDELSDEVDFDHVDKSFESLTTLRPKLLMKLLTACRSIKVRRLFFVFADRHQHAWLKHLNPNKVNFGTGPRALVKGGVLHPTHRIYVPKDFVLAGAMEGHRND